MTGSFAQVYDHGAILPILALTLAPLISQLRFVITGDVMLGKYVAGRGGRSFDLRLRLRSLFNVAVIWIALAGAASANVLGDVKMRGVLNCGVAPDFVGFSASDGNQVWQGFDVDLCRAIAAAVLGDGKAVSFVPVAETDGADALASGQVDVLSRSTPWTFAADNALGFEFTGINYYDGQGFMIAKDRKITSVKELADGTTICVKSGDVSEKRVTQYFSANQISVTVVPIETGSEGSRTYLGGACDVYSMGVSGLAASRATFENPADHVILPEIISKEPLGLAVRDGDNVWASIVRWTLNALIAAEELGVTSANIEELSEGTDNTEIKKLLGVDGDLGAAIGLDREWAKRAIMAAGNYGEIFEKNIGETTPIGLARGLNALWTEGGLQYALPFR